MKKKEAGRDVCWDDEPAVLLHHPVLEAAAAGHHTHAMMFLMNCMFSRTLILTLRKNTLGGGGLSQEASFI